jgi:tetratricopeptide (TPR) repeat protein
MTQLPDDVYEGVKQLCATGDAAAEKERYRDAIRWYSRALELLPPPATKWDAATWIFAAIGDAYFLSGDSSAAFEAFDKAMESPDSLGNPFLHLRRGQALFDLGMKEQAGNELARAYMLEDEDIFDNEDPKYLKFLKTVLREPQTSA